MLKPTLDKNNIPFLSTHEICSPNDSRVFNGVNSHFRPEKDLELAELLIRIINNRLARYINADELHRIWNITFIVSFISSSKSNSSCSISKTPIWESIAKPGKKQFQMK